MATVDGTPERGEIGLLGTVGFPAVAVETLGGQRQAGDVLGPAEDVRNDLVAIAEDP